MKTTGPLGTARAPVVDSRTAFRIGLIAFLAIAALGHHSWGAVAAMQRLARVKRLLGLLGLLGLVSGAAIGEGPDVGPPLPVPPSLYVLDVPFLHLGGAEPLLLRFGEFRFDLDLQYGNTFSHTWQARTFHANGGVALAPFTREEAEYMHREFPGETMVFLDAEATRLVATATVGLPFDLVAGIRVPWVSWNALLLDRPVETFHEAVGLADVSRPNFPRGRFQVVLQAPDGPLMFDDEPPSSGLGDVSVFFRWAHAPGPRTLVSAELDLKIPTGSAADYRGSGSADAGLLAGLVHRLGRTGRFGLHLEAGLVVPGRFRNEREVTIATAPFLRVLASADVRLGRKTTAALWLDAEQSPQHRVEMGDAARTAVEVGLGLTRVLPGLGTVSLGLVENTPRFGDAADIALTLRFRPAL